MRVVFQIYGCLPRGTSSRLIYAALEECHPENIEFRAKVLLLTSTIAEQPELVKALRFDDGALLYERTTAARR